MHCGKFFILTLFVLYPFYSANAMNPQDEGQEHTLTRAIAPNADSDHAEDSDYDPDEITMKHPNGYLLTVPGVSYMEIDGIAPSENKVLYTTLDRYFTNKGFLASHIWFNAFLSPDTYSELKKQKPKPNLKPGQFYLEIPKSYYAYQITIWTDPTSQEKDTKGHLVLWHAVADNFDEDNESFKALQAKGKGNWVELIKRLYWESLRDLVNSWRQWHEVYYVPSSPSAPYKKMKEMNVKPLSLTLNLGDETVDVK